MLHCTLRIVWIMLSCKHRMASSALCLREIMANDHHNAGVMNAQQLQRGGCLQGV